MTAEDRQHTIPLTPDARVQAVEGHITSQLAGEAVILDLETSVYYGLDDTGARIWSLIQEETTVRALCDELLQAYEVTEEQCTHEVLQLLATLRDRYLINVR